jgi:hypothetical protein
LSGQSGIICASFHPFQNYDKFIIETLCLFVKRSGREVLFSVKAMPRKKRQDGGQACPTRLKKAGAAAFGSSESFKMPIGASARHRLGRKTSFS